MVDSKEGVICVEWIDGNSVRRLIPGGEEGEEEDEDLGSAEEDQDELTKLGLAQGKKLTSRQSPKRIV